MREFSVRLIRNDGKEIKVGKVFAYNASHAMSLIPAKYTSMGKIVLLEIHIEE